MPQNLSYFWDMKTNIVVLFIFATTLFFPLIQRRFVKHKPFISEESKQSGYHYQHDQIQFDEFMVDTSIISNQTLLKIYWRSHAWLLLHVTISIGLICIWRGLLLLLVAIVVHPKMKTPLTIYFVIWKQSMKNCSKLHA